MRGAENAQRGQGILSDCTLERLVHNTEDTNQVGVFWLGEKFSKDPDVIESPLSVGDAHNPVKEVRNPIPSGMIIPWGRISEHAMREGKGVYRFRDRAGCVPAPTWESIWKEGSPF